MWLFDEKAHQIGERNNTHLELLVPAKTVSELNECTGFLEDKQGEKGIEIAFNQELIAVDGSKKEATFKSTQNEEVTVKKFDLIHVVPPMSPPNFIKTSPLANIDGWVDVDKHTLQSTKFKNVFAIGDCTSIPSAKTTSAITKQTPVLVQNMIQVMNGGDPISKYHGYTSCPLVAGKERIVLAEFEHEGKIISILM